MKQEIIYIFKGFVFLNKKIGNLDLFTDRQKYLFEATIVGALIFIVLTLASINQKLTVITENFKTNAPHIKAEGCMDWTQTFTIGAVYAFYHITEKRIDKTEQTIDRMEAHHREDMKAMDAKWERLFERLLLQDQKSKK